MKTRFIFLVALLASVFNITGALGQVSIKSDGSPPDNSAMLDVASITKGFLMPRLTRSELNFITIPANGLMVYCTNCGPDGSGSIAIYMDEAWHILTANCLYPLPPEAGTHIPYGYQIIWKWRKVPGAAGYRWSTEDNFSGAIEMGSDTLKTETQLTLNTSYTRYVWAYTNCGNSNSGSLIHSTLSYWICGDSLTINHLASGGVAAVDKTVTYGTVGDVPGASGKCWIASNLGADHQASGMNDATEASAGWYWQFNRKQGYKHDGTTRTPNTPWIEIISENQDWQSSVDPCTLELGSGWRMPSESEWNSVDATGGWEDLEDAWNSLLKLHTAGYMWWHNNGQLLARGSQGFIWTSNQTTSNTSLGWFMHIHSDGSNTNPNWYKAHGFSVRCIKD